MKASQIITGVTGLLGWLFFSGAVILSIEGTPSFVYTFGVLVVWAVVVWYIVHFKRMVRLTEDEIVDLKREMYAYQDLAKTRLSTIQAYQEKEFEREVKKKGYVIDRENNIITVTKQKTSKQICMELDRIFSEIFLMDEDIPLRSEQPEHPADYRYRVIHGWALVINKRKYLSGERIPK